MSQIEELRAEIARLNAEAEPTRKQIRALTNSIGPIEERVRELHRQVQDAERRAEREAQAAAVLPVWEAYLRGERATIEVARGAYFSGNVKVTPLARVGEWVAHESLGEDPIHRYSLTHGPSGMRADGSDSLASLVALAVKLNDVVPMLPMADACAVPGTSALHATLGAVVHEHRRSSGDAA